MYRDLQLDALQTNNMQLQKYNCHKYQGTNLTNTEFAWTMDVHPGSNPWSATQSPIRG